MTGEHRHTGHALAKPRWTTIISKQPSWIGCECGWDFEALPDRAFPDPHEPHLQAYLEHRRSVKAGDPKVLGQGWVRMSLERTA